MSESPSETDASERSTRTWTREQAARAARTDEVVASVGHPPDDHVDPDRHVWDTWFLRERDGSVAEVDGYRVVFSLTAPAHLLPVERHDVAEIRCYYSRDGRAWRDGGPIFDDANALGSRRWSGCALLDDGEVYVYYTAAGRRDEDNVSYTQRVALARGGTVRVDDDLSVEGPWDHSILLEPDGEWYEREEQAGELTYAFRDPWFFEDAETGDTCLLFEATAPVPEEVDVGGDDPAVEEFNGSVGLAVSPSGDPAEFELRRPLLDAVGVSHELERPHLVVRDGTYYLFVSAHRHVFAPGLEGVEGLYGFAADSLRGEYDPLNDSGLVLANPSDAPFRTYAWLVYSHREELLVTSFLNYAALGGRSLDDVALVPEEEQFDGFGGTFAPTVRLELDGRGTRVLGALDPGHLPIPDDDLPEPSQAENRSG